MSGSLTAGLARSAEIESGNVIYSLSKFTSRSAIPPRDVAMVLKWENNHPFIYEVPGVVYMTRQHLETVTGSSIDTPKYNTELMGIQFSCFNRAMAQGMDPKAFVPVTVINEHDSSRVFMRNAMSSDINFSLRGMDKEIYIFGDIVTLDILLQFEEEHPQFYDSDSTIDLTTAYIEQLTQNRIESDISKTLMQLFQIYYIAKQKSFKAEIVNSACTVDGCGCEDGDDDEEEMEDDEVKQ